MIQKDARFKYYVMQKSIHFTGLLKNLSFFVLYIRNSYHVRLDILYPEVQRKCQTMQKP